MVEDTSKLFEALSRTRILTPRDYNTIYNLLSQIYNILYSYMDDDMKKKHDKLEMETREEMGKRIKGGKDTFFAIKSNSWERELRAFNKKIMKEQEFSPGGI